MSQRHWSQGELVTVLSPPPPERFHPSGHTSYQEIEEPIVTGQVGQSAVAQIIIVHPTIKGGEEFFYELWPVDRGSTWVENFGLQSATRRWRRTRQCDDRRLRELAALRDQSPGQPKPSGGCSDFFKDRKVAVVDLATIVVKAKTARAKEQAGANKRANAERKAQAKADKARAKEQAGANKRANAERKAQAKADKARAKEQAGANKRANAERKAQAKADKARAKEQQARANERASSEKKARDKAGKSRTSERARPGL
ncbi:actin-like protein 10 [Penicillium chrysogenum]|uniref:actin-like protein 10 n=1 Tax=Penicillium chrysogenum TaxID=5076 RepID=UPI0024DF13BD|nr:actin-like protein 10 [Penicillium chrysogenum]KAJ5227672.1 actin-like protein 10 [Penicillium chrysogenum]